MVAEPYNVAPPVPRTFVAPVARIGFVLLKRANPDRSPCGMFVFVCSSSSGKPDVPSTFSARFGCTYLQMRYMVVELTSKSYLIITS